MLAAANNQMAARIDAIDLRATGKYPSVERFVVFSEDRVGAQGDDVGVCADGKAGRPP